MANPNVGKAVASAWETLITNKPVDQVFDDFWLFKHFTKENGGLITRDGGRQIAVSVDYQKNPNFKSYSDMEVLDTNRVDTVDEAQFDWKEHGGAIVWSEIELFKNSGDSAKFDYLANLVENAKNSHKEDIALAMVSNGTGNSGKNINGLKNLIPDTATDGSPGGISRTTYSWWRANATSGAQSASDFDNLRAAYREMYNACSKGYSGNHPKTLVSGLGAFEGYESILVANERFTSKNEGDAGFKNAALKFKGATYGYDERIADDDAYFLNPDGLKVVVGKGHFMKMGKDIEAINQFSFVRKFHTFMQMVTVEPRLLGVVHSIS